MSDQAELLRKRREARQKRILASGESRLSKITSTSGAGAQSMPTTPTPSVVQARDQLLKKEQEEKEARRRLSNASTTSQVAAGVAASIGGGHVALETTEEDVTSAGDPGTGTTTTLPTLDEVNDSTLQDKQEKAEILITPRQSRRSSVASSGGSPKTLGTGGVSTPSTTSTSQQPKQQQPPVTVVEDYDADPDDSLGAPTPIIASHSPFGQPFPAASSSTFRRRPSNLDASSSSSSTTSSMDPFRSLTRTLSNQGSTGGGRGAAFNELGMHSKAGSMSSSGGGGGFTVITPQEDSSVRWWNLLHLVLSAVFGFWLIYQEHKRNGSLARFDALADEKPTAEGFFQVARL
ncbi:hypothetical protein DFQ26_001793, partial [Actinomortierella ambigua]